ncbi:DnaJ protein like [Apostasia shenzhenica]|uniref:DnaJ protein like n=1 Tax=Apostasia shenzhenica TaxID=1088818 RepID=A0A2I0A869_9ASPA|nr:DnaJ protein like [Apostasia shenzhenica]
MGNHRDFYEVLNIPKDSSPEQIRRAYKTLVKKWHPDKHPPSSKLEAEARFKAIAEAYEALHDREDRDLFAGASGRRSGSNRGGTSPAPPPPSSPGTAPRTPRRDSKDSYFSSSRPGFASFSGPGRRQPQPVERKLECTLEELFHGCKKEICFSRDVIVNGIVTQKEETQKIKVKPGWKKGTKITFEGMGDELPGCLPPDAVFVIAEKEHPLFKRVEDDLVLNVEVPLVNALTGWNFSFRLIGGEKMGLSFQNEIIHPGFEKVLKGHGMPLVGQKGVRGDLKIRFHVQFPTELSDKQRAQIQEAFRVRC